jgi:hypothetical protein
VTAIDEHTDARAMHGSFATTRESLAASFAHVDRTLEALGDAGQGAAEACDARIAELDDVIVTIYQVRRALEAGLEAAVAARYPALVRENRVLNARVRALEAQLGQEQGAHPNEAPTERLPRVRGEARRRGPLRRRGL